MSNVQVTVVEINAGSQAEHIGIKLGDVVAYYNGYEITSNKVLSQVVQEAKNQNKKDTELVILRNDTKLRFTVTLEPLGFICVDKNSEQEREYLNLYNKPDIVPVISIVLYSLSLISLLVGFILAACFWPDQQKTLKDFNEYFDVYGISIILFVTGILNAVLLSAIGKALSYLKTIVENTKK